MLRKPAILLMLVVYVVTASGFALNLHYCFDRLSSIRIDAPAKECSNNPRAKKMTCCKDKYFVVKVKDAHQSASFSFSGKVFVGVVPAHQFIDFAVIYRDPMVSEQLDRGPPISPPVSAWLKNCNFRI